MAKASRGTQTREDILRTGGRLFSLHGYFHTSMNDILEAVSLSKGAFYHHFQSKEDLALAMLERMGLEYEREVMVPVRAAGEPGACLRAMFSRIVELNESGQWDNCLLLARLAQETAEQEGALAEQVAETVNRLTGFWEELLGDAQSAGAVRRDLDAHTLAQLIVSTFLGTIGFRELQSQTNRLAKIAQQMQLMLAK